MSRHEGLHWSTTRFVLVSLGIGLAGILLGSVLIIAIGMLPIWH